MRWLPLCLGILPSLISITAVAQTTYSGRVVDEKGMPVQDVNVLLYRTQSTLVGYTFTGADGRFRITTKEGVSPIAIGFVLLGYETKRIDIEAYSSGMDIKLQSVTFQLREVNIRPERIRQKQDTLVYSVSGFKLSQDRSIADVIIPMRTWPIRWIDTNSDSTVEISLETISIRGDGRHLLLMFTPYTIYAREKYFLTSLLAYDTQTLIVTEYFSYRAK